MPATTAALLTFALGSAASQALPTLTAAAPLLLGVLLVLLLLGLLALVPPVGVLLSRLRQSRPGSAFKWVGTPLYAGLLGLLMSAGTPVPVWVWSAGLLLFALLLGTLAGVSRAFWEPRMAGVARWQRWLSLLTLSAFLLLLAANWLQLVPAADALNVLLLGLLSGLLVLGCVQLPLARSGHPMDRAGAVVFPGIGLLFLLTMLAA